jgi:hypothetical protein
MDRNYGYNSASVTFFQRCGEGIKILALVMLVVSHLACTGFSGISVFCPQIIALLNMSDAEVQLQLTVSML